MAQFQNAEKMKELIDMCFEKIGIDSAVLINNPKSYDESITVDGYYHIFHRPSSMDRELRYHLMKETPSYKFNRKPDKSCRVEKASFEERFKLLEEDKSVNFIVKKVVKLRVIDVVDLQVSFLN